MKKKVLIMAGYYIPSIKGGGPIQSIKNIIDNLSYNFDFYIVATDRDLGDEQPFDNIVTDRWIIVGKASVFYTNISKLDWRKTKMIIESSQCKTIYLNSFFDYKFTIVPILLNKTKEIDVDKIIIAPRGQFSPGALNLKRNKKKVFIKLVKLMGVFKNVIWHATNDLEKEYIQSIFGHEINVVVANNLTENYNNLVYNKNLKKNKGELKVVFMSRIHPKKNLKQAIELLQKLNGDVIFNIYGPIEDNEYWRRCKEVISLLPPNIEVNYNGIINHDKIINMFNNHHIFLFPTLGENFGHVISEALIGGCPVIISDQTPWRYLSNKGIGWDINLSQDEEFVKAIQRCIVLNQLEYNEFSKKAFEYGLLTSNKKEDIKKYYKLFNGRYKRMF